MVDENGITVAAYVFQKGVSGWTTGSETAALKTNLTDFPFFRGGRVAIKDDQIAVSAPGFLNDVNGVPGEILIYEKDPSATWTEQFETAHLGYDESVKGAQLGMSVVFDSEVSLLAGITDDDDSDDASGSVLVYRKPVSGWVDANQNQRFSSTDLMSSGDNFGAFCDISGSYAVLGAPGDDHAGPSCGAAYIFENQNGNWVKVAKLTASDARRNDGFGNSVSIDGDIVVVGAPFVDELAADGSIVTNNMGAVYIF